MTSRDASISALVVGMWFAYSTATDAHRLDEYLQATLLSVDRDGVTVEIGLTPGVTVAPQIMMLIDSDGDGRISSAEGEAYAREVLRSVVLVVDDRPARLVLEESKFPEFGEMKLGMGTIRLRAAAKVNSDFGRHHLSYRNTHKPELSVYLANVIVPSDQRLQIAAPTRDRTQQSLALDYTVALDGLWARISWLLAAVGSICAGVMARRPRGVTAGSSER
jgi:hypothetical protein